MKAFCINLNHRTDRWNRSKREFEKHSLKVHRVQAQEPDGNTLKAREAACALSHMTIWKHMVEENISKALILEDDVEFQEGAIPIAMDSIGDLDYDMVYISGNDVRPAKRVNGRLMKLSRTWAMSAYIITKDFAKFLLENTHTHQPIDVQVANFHATHKCYGFGPYLAWQRPDFSDIQKKHVDYSKYMMP